MANNFRLYGTSLATTDLTNLITPAETSEFIVGSIVIANTHATTAGKVTISVFDSSASATFNILTNEDIVSEYSREVLSRPFILEKDDILKIQVDTINIFDVLVSYLDRNRE